MRNIMRITFIFLAVSFLLSACGASSNKPLSVQIEPSPLPTVVPVPTALPSPSPSPSVSPVTSVTPAPITLTLTLNGQSGVGTVLFGTPVALNWTSVNAASCMLKSSDSTVLSSQLNSPTLGIALGNASLSTVYLLTCNNTGVTAAVSFSLTVTKNDPTLNLSYGLFSGSSLTVPYNSVVNVGFGFGTASGCSIIDSNTQNSLSSLQSGNIPLGPLTKSTSVTVSCSGYSPLVATIAVAPPPPPPTETLNFLYSLDSSVSVFSESQGVVTWNSSGAVSCALLNGSGQTIAPGLPTAGTYLYTSNVSTTLKLSCVNTVGIASLSNILTINVATTASTGFCPANSVPLYHFSRLANPLSLINTYQWDNYALTFTPTFSNAGSVLLGVFACVPTASFSAGLITLYTLYDSVPLYALEHVYSISTQEVFGTLGYELYYGMQEEARYSILQNPTSVSGTTSVPLSRCGNKDLTGRRLLSLSACIDVPNYTPIDTSTTGSAVPMGYVLLPN